MYFIFCVFLKLFSEADKQVINLINFNVNKSFIHQFLIARTMTSSRLHNISSNLRVRNMHPDHPWHWAE